MRVGNYFNMYFFNSSALFKKNSFVPLSQSSRHNMLKSTHTKTRKTPSATMTSPHHIPTVLVYDITPHTPPYKLAS
jgi:hypothetical protein